VSVSSKRIDVFAFKSCCLEVSLRSCFPFSTETSLNKCLEDFLSFMRLDDNSNSLRELVFRNPSFLIALLYSPSAINKSSKSSSSVSTGTSRKVGPNCVESIILHRNVAVYVSVFARDFQPPAASDSFNSPTTTTFKRGNPAFQVKSSCSFGLASQINSTPYLTLS